MHDFLNSCVVQIQVFVYVQRVNYTMPKFSDMFVCVYVCICVCVCVYCPCVISYKINEGIQNLMCISCLSHFRYGPSPFSLEW